MVNTNNHKQYFQDIFSYFRRFVDMSPEEFEQIIPYFEIREFPKKTRIVKVGEVDRYFNIIVKGLVRKYLLENKKEVTLQLSTEGHMIHAEISFNLQIPSDCTVDDKVDRYRTGGACHCSIWTG